MLALSSSHGSVVNALDFHRVIGVNQFWFLLATGTHMSLVMRISVSVF